jgi:hypothetical protein
MTDNAPCKHGCGTSVGPEDLTCPSCGGQQPHPEFRPPGGPGLLERGCIVVMIVGGLLASIALLVTKVIVG